MSLLVGADTLAPESDVRGFFGAHRRRAILGAAFAQRARVFLGPLHRRRVFASADFPGGMLRDRQSSPRDVLARRTIWPA